MGLYEFESNLVYIVSFRPVQDALCQSEKKETSQAVAGCTLPLASFFSSF